MRKFDNGQICFEDFGQPVDMNPKSNIVNIEKVAAQGKTIPTKYEEKISTIRKIYAQQKEVYDNHTHNVKDRIVAAFP